MQIQFTPDGQKLFLGGHFGFVIRDLASGQSQAPELWSRGAFFFGMTSDSCHVLVAQNNNPPPPHGWIACCPVDDPTPNAAIWKRTLPHHIHSGPLRLADERFALIAVMGEANRFLLMFRYTVYSVATGEQLSVVEGPPIGSPDPVVSPDGRMVAALDSRHIVIFAADNFARPLALLQGDNDEYFFSIAFHPSGQYLAATSDDAAVRIYDIATWQVAKTFAWGIGRMHSIAFSPDGTLAAAGSDKGKVVVWDVDL